MSNLARTLIDLYMLVVIIRVALTWFEINSQSPIIRFMADITDPVLSRIRNVIPSFSGLDFSPVILILALMLLKNILF